MAMLRLDNLFVVFGAILFVLTSISVISFTSKFIFGSGKAHKTTAPQYLYDPDVYNATVICPFESRAYQIHYNRTACFNKTMHHRYVPWIRFDVWKNFREANAEKRRRRAEQLEAIASAENEANETRSDGGNNTEKVEVVPDASAKRDNREEPSKVAATILAALLVVSSIVAFGEVFREKFLSKKKNSLAGANEKCSPADEGILQTRSLTDERSPEAVRSAKVTQTLVHQSSLDKPFSRLSSEVKPLYFRRQSVPSHMNATGSASNIPDSSYATDRNLHSSDAPTVRRGSRHFIRRH